MAGVFEAGELQHQALRGNGVAEHPGQQVLDELEAGDGPAELLALDGVAADEALLPEPERLLSGLSEELKTFRELS